MVPPDPFSDSLHPPSLKATASRLGRNAGELRRVTPHQRCHGLLPVGLHDTIRDALPVHDLGSMEGGYADLVGQGLQGNPPTIKSCVNRAVEAQSDKLSA